jgi:hypothetical protein
MQKALRGNAKHLAESEMKMHVVWWRTLMIDQYKPS